MNTITSERYALVDGVPTVETIVYELASEENEGETDPRYRRLFGYEGLWIWVMASNRFAAFPDEAEGDDRFGVDGDGYFGLPVRDDVVMLTQDEFVKVVEAQQALAIVTGEAAHADLAASMRADWDAKAAGWKKAGVDPVVMLGERP